MAADTEAGAAAVALTAAEADVRAFDLLKELVAITSERWISASRFQALAYAWSLEDISAQVRFLTQIKVLLRGMPVQVFPDLDARQAAMNALQDALDTAIEREEQQAPPPDAMTGAP